MTTAHQIKLNYYYYYYYNHFTAPWTVSGTIRVSQYQKGKTNLDLLERESVCGSEISWAICKSAPRPRQITMPASYHSVFYRPDALPATQPTVSKQSSALSLDHCDLQWYTHPGTPCTNGSSSLNTVLSCVSDLKHVGRWNVLGVFIERPRYNGIGRPPAVVFNGVAGVLLARRKHLDRRVALHLTSVTTRQ